MSPSSVTTSYKLMGLMKKSGLRAFTITCKRNVGENEKNENGVEDGAV
jgi:hypothetical protein